MNDLDFDPATHIRVYRYDQNGTGHLTIEALHPDLTAPSLQDAKDAARAMVKGERSRYELSAVVWDSSTFDADMQSKERLRTAARRAAEFGPGYHVDWKLADNTERTMSADDIEAVIRAIDIRDMRAHEINLALRAQIERANSPAIVKTLRWPSSEAEINELLDLPSAP